MSQPPQEPQPYSPLPYYGPPPLPKVTMSPEERTARNEAVARELATSAVLVLGAFTVLGVLGAWIWSGVTTLPEFTRIATTGSMDEEQLARQFGINGWFLTISAAGGVLAGVVLMLVRRSSPVVMVGLVAAGGGLASLVMVKCGLAWGPADPNVALASAQLGDKVPVQLKPDVDAIYFSWPVAALLGALLALWLLESAANRRIRAEMVHPGYAGDG